MKQEGKNNNGENNGEKRRIRKLETKLKDLRHVVTREAN